MSHVDRILEVLDQGLQHSTERGYPAQHAPPSACWRCEARPAGTGPTGLCDPCLVDLYPGSGGVARAWRYFSPPPIDRALLDPDPGPHSIVVAVRRKRDGTWLTGDPDATRREARPLDTTRRPDPADG